MAIEVVNLSLEYGRLPALVDVNVRADCGQVIAVLGPNAAGKSTLLRCLIGALSPTRGHVALDGEAVHRLSPRRLAERMAYVSQRSIVSASFSVRQVIELGRYALAPNASRVTHALERFDLVDVQHRLYRTLSVGQQQRVALARAMAQLAENGVLVLDEPTAAMDLKHAAETYEILRKSARNGATVILAMHDLSTAAMIADCAWLLERGSLVAAGSTCEVLEAERLRNVFGVGFAWINDPAGRPRLLHDAPAAG